MGFPDKKTAEENDPEKIVLYAEASPAFRAQVDKLIEGVKADPFNLPAAIAFGKPSMARLAETCGQIAQKNDGQLLSGGQEVKELSLQLRADLDDVDVHLCAAQEILELYIARYMPMTYGGCIDIGAMAKEEFDKRHEALQQAAVSGREAFSRLTAPAKQSGEESVREEQGSEEKRRGLKKTGIPDRYKLKPPGAS